MGIFFGFLFLTLSISPENILLKHNKNLLFVVIFLSLGIWVDKRSELSRLIFGLILTFLCWPK